jgi:hypothetical protein
MRRTSDQLQHLYEGRPRKDKRGVDLISDTLPFGRLWYAEPNAISNTCFHRWRHAQRLVNPAVYAMKRDRVSLARSHFVKVSQRCYS